MSSARCNWTGYECPAQLQEFTVPTGVAFLDVTADGASGGDGSVGYGLLTNLGGSGAAGGRVKATIRVTPGQRLKIFVAARGGDAVNDLLQRARCADVPEFGSANATNALWAPYIAGYGAGGDVCSGGSGGAGGGATSITTGSDSKQQPLIVAGGGAGGGGGGGIYDYSGGNGGAGGADPDNGIGQSGASGTGIGAGAGGQGASTGGTANGGRAGYEVSDGFFDWYGAAAGGGGGGGGGYPHAGEGGQGGTVGGGGGGGGAGGRSFAGGAFFPEFSRSPLGSGADGKLTLSWKTPISQTFMAVNPSVVAERERVIYEATVQSYSGVSRPTGRVQFSIGDQVICNDTLEPDQENADRATASCRSRSAPVGHNEVTARYLGDKDFLPSSNTTDLTVTSRR